MSTAGCILASVLAVLLTTHVRATVSESSGVAPGGSAWRIAVPEDWAPGDGLVLMQHGHRFDRITVPSLGPSVQAMLDDGYAIAAPGYRQSGWTVADAVDDNAEVLQIFRERVGAPGTVIAHGGSMGALIALKLAEDARLRSEIDGVLALCPVADGVGWWDQAFDLRLAYDTLCADVPGGQLPAGDAPMPWASNADVLQDAPTDPLAYPASIRALPAVQACLGLQRSDAERDAGMRERVAALKALTGTQDEDALAARLVYAHFGLTALLRTPQQLDGANPFFNRVVRAERTRSLQYRQIGTPRMQLPADFDARVARIALDDFARLAFHAANSLDGNIVVPVLSSHTQQDGVALAPAQQNYLRDRLHAPLALAVVAEQAPSHCGYTQPEYDALWTRLRAWAEQPDSAAPTAESIQTTCLARDDGVCRFDPQATQALRSGQTAQHGPRFPLMNPLGSVTGQKGEGSTAGGLWWDPARPAQGLMIEELDGVIGNWYQGEQRVAVSWFTWAPQSDPEPGPRWLHGIGRVYEHGVVIDDMLEVRGGRFGALLNPARIRYERWGRIEIAFGLESPILRYAGPPAWGSGEMQLQQLTLAGLGLDSSIAFSPPPTIDFHRSGTYYDRGHPAGGWVLNQFSGESVDVRSMLLWFTWDADGRQLWMFGIDENDDDGLRFEMQRAVSGGRFEPGYTQADVQLSPWGEITLEGDTCVEGRITAVEWRAQTPGFGDDRVEVARLTAPMFLHAIADCTR